MNKHFNSKKWALILVPLFVLSVFFLVLVTQSAASGPPDATPATFVSQDNLFLTVYNDSPSIISDVRTFEMNEGLNRVDFVGVNNPGVNTVVLYAPEGTYLTQVAYEAERRDAVNTRILIEANLGEEVSFGLAEEGGTVSGVLTLIDGDSYFISQDDGSLRRVYLSEIETFDLPNVPSTQNSPPVLTLYVYSPSAGQQQLMVTYMAWGLSWNIDYNLNLGADNRSVDMTGWVTINNSLGQDFENAMVALAAGSSDAVDFVGRDTGFAVPTATALASQTQAQAYGTPNPNTIPATGGGGGGGNVLDTSRPEVPGDVRFTLSLPGLVTINQGQTFIEFLADVQSDARNLFVYDASPRIYGYSGFVTSSDYGINEYSLVQNYLEFETRDAEGEGIALPGGIMRLYEQNSEGNTTALGTTRLPYTPANEIIQIYLDNSENVTGERRQSEFQILSDDAVQESIEIRLRNRGDEAITVTVPERMTRSARWEILQSNTPYEQPDTFGIEYVVEVPAGGETVLSYTVLYTRTN